MMNKEFLKELNAAYSLLETKKAEIVHALFHRIFTIECGWYNGHYHRDDDGSYFMDSYPIPVISVKGFCDIEIQFESIQITAKLSRNAALNQSYEKLKAYRFEAFGVEDYLADYYHDGLTVDDLKENIRSCDEKEIAFSFSFPFETEGKAFFEFVKLLRREGFYY